MFGKPVPRQLPALPVVFLVDVVMSSGEYVILHHRGWGFCSSIATDSCITESVYKMYKFKNMNEKVNKLHWHSIGIAGAPDGGHENHLAA